MKNNPVIISCIITQKNAEEALIAYRNAKDDKESLATLCAYAIRRAGKACRGKIDNDEDIEDIAQDVAVTVIEQVDNFDPTRCKNGRDTTVSAWIDSIIRSRVNDYWRKNSYVDNGKRITKECCDISDYSEYLPDTIYDTPEAYFERKHLLEVVKVALGNIKEDYAKVIKAHYVDELPVREIAAITNYSEPKVKKMLERGRKQMEKYIDSHHLLA